MLDEILIEKIKNEGPMSFHDYMEMCLYYPELGYYTSATDKIGQAGDYYTSSNLTPAFGATIGKQLEQMWHQLGKGKFTIIEYGAGTGNLCRDILNYLKHNEAFYSQLDYCIIEKSPAMRAREQAYLSEKVSWCDSIKDIPNCFGCILSNELIDNLSVHSVVMQDELMEVFVNHKNGFTEVLQPASNELKDYLETLTISLPKGFRTEINIDATEWIKEIASTLIKGYVLTIDYGGTASELYCAYKAGGTLMCYNKHRTSENLYKNIGNQDITTHVNFSALHHWGSEHGLDCCGFTDQAHFLAALGIDNCLKEMRDPHISDRRNYEKENFLKYTLLADMGSKYKVLIQRKGLPEQALIGLNVY